MNKLVAKLQSEVNYLGVLIEQDDTLLCASCKENMVFNENSKGFIWIQYINGIGQSWLTTAVKNLRRDILLGVRPKTQDDLD